MATQAIRFTGPPNQTITLDVFTLSSDTAEQSGLTCTESTNRKGLYTTANFTDTLSGRHYIVKKISGVAVGSDFVTLLNASATYDAEAITAVAGTEKLRKFLNNKRTPISGAATGYTRFRVFEDDGVTAAFDLDWKNSDGTIEPV